MAAAPLRKPAKPKASPPSKRAGTLTKIATKATKPTDEREIGTTEDLASNFRKVVAKIEDDDYYHIVSKYGGKRYIVFHASKFDKGVDSKKTYMTIAARRLKDIPSTVFLASRHLMFKVVITYNNIPRYIIEPRTAAGRLLAAKLGVEDLDALRDIINGGRLVDLLELVPGEVEEERDAAVKKAKRLDRRLNQQVAKVDELLFAKQSLEQGRGTILGDVGRMKNQLQEERNIRHSCESRITQLEHALRLAEVEPPPYRPYK